MGQRPDTFVLLRHCTCSNSWFHLRRRRSPFSIGGCYGNAAEKRCDMTHSECQESRAAVMQYAAVSVCVGSLQRGEIGFLFSRKLKAARRRGCWRQPPPQNGRACAAFRAVFTCLFHAPRSPRRPSAVPRCCRGGLSRPNCSGSLGNSARSFGGVKVTSCC